MQSDSSLFEINPVLKTSDDKILAVDAKVSLDDNALFRHKDYQELRDLREENPVEVEAKEVGLIMLLSMAMLGVWSMVQVWPWRQWI